MMSEPTQPEPTENAQIMCMLDIPNTAVIYRFNSAKKGRKAYEDFVKAWKGRQSWLADSNRYKIAHQHYDMSADMFDGCIDLDRVVSVSFVEWPKRGKFVPRMV